MFNIFKMMSVEMSGGAFMLSHGELCRDHMVSVEEAYEKACEILGFWEAYASHFQVLKDFTDCYQDLRLLRTSLVLEMESSDSKVEKDDANYNYIPVVIIPDWSSLQSSF